MKWMVITPILVFISFASCEKQGKAEFVCSVVSPQPAAILYNDSAVVFEVSISHDVSRAEFYFDEELIASVFRYPLTITWTPRARSGGNHIITVILYPFEFEKTVITVPVVFQYYKGESLQGGNIFKLDETGLHGLAVSDQDLIFKNSSDLRWGISEFIGTNDSVNGSANTQILANSPLLSSYFWSSFKYGYNASGYSDWYVPSKSEMLELLDFTNNSDGIITMDRTYWTSTECCRSNACAIDFKNNKVLVTLKEDSLFRVRPIRKF